jgi:FkbM family methyltransferase
MSKRYGRALASLVNLLTVPQHPWRRAHSRLRTAEALVQSHQVETPHGKLVLVSAQPKALWYPQHFLTREPETIAWIDRFEPPAVYWDIGANIGQFALYAALRPGISVVAFEPAAASFAGLCRNIERNRLGGRIEAFCIAACDRNRIGSLNLSSTEAGSVLGSFDSTEDCLGRQLDIAFSQSALGFALDDFRRQFGRAAPNYVKIDVDGTENEVLVGMRETLADPALRSVLIEIEERDTPRTRRIMGQLGAAGFVFDRRGVGQGGAVNGIFVRAAARRPASAAQ